MTDFSAGNCSAIYADHSEVLHLRPGDVLVLKTKGTISADALGAFKEGLQKQLGFPIMVACFDMASEIKVLRGDDYEKSAKAEEARLESLLPMKAENCPDDRLGQKP